MNKTKGLYLPAAGFRSSNDGSGTTATSRAGFGGYYWSTGASGSDGGYYLIFNGATSDVYGVEKTSGFSVRCVK